MTAIIVDALGVEPAPTPTAVRERATAGTFFWLDIFGGVEAAPTDVLGELGLARCDIAWALRFGQTGRMAIGRQMLRATTWMAEPNGGLIEVHLVSTQRCMLTVWSGEPVALDEIRQQFSERVGGLERPYHAAGILLQLLLSTLDHHFRVLDIEFDDLRMRLDKGSSPGDFALLGRKQQKLQSVVSSFNRYSSSVRAAMVGVEAVAGMDQRGAEELNEYAEQVEDVDERLHEARRWMSDMSHDYAVTIAQRQGEQINRLTLVSLIFLPVTALTGFFGMNFNWMIDAIGGEAAFLVLGVMLPLLCVAFTISWLVRQGLMRLRLSSTLATKPQPRLEMGN